MHYLSNLTSPKRKQKILLWEWQTISAHKSETGMRCLAVQLRYHKGWGPGRQLPEVRTVIMGSATETNPVNQSNRTPCSPARFCRCLLHSNRVVHLRWVKCDSTMSAEELKYLEWELKLPICAGSIRKCSFISIPSSLSSPADLATEMQWKEKLWA